MIGKNLSKIMALRGINKRGLSAFSGVPESRISEIVSGKTKNPRVETVRKLAGALGMTADDLYSEHLDGILGELSGQDKICVAEHHACYDPTEQPYIAKVAALMADMDVETQKDICLSVEKEKLLRDLLRQKESDKKAG